MLLIPGRLNPHGYWELKHPSIWGVSCALQMLLMIMTDWFKAIRTTCKACKLAGTGLRVGCGV